jgi:hypothetical protein
MEGGQLPGVRLGKGIYQALLNAFPASPIALQSSACSRSENLTALS